LENINIGTSKTFTLQGGWDSNFTSQSNDSSLTVIDGKGSGVVINIQPKPAATINLTIEGFTIQNGNAYQGAGILVSSSGVNSHVSLTLNNNTITGNVASNRGGGIFIRSDKSSIDATLTDNIISQNMANNEGGGIRVGSANGGSAAVTLVKNIIRNNTVTHSVEGEGGWDGGGVAAFASGSGNTTLSLKNNLITNNEAGFGGGVFAYAWGSDDAVVTTVLNNNIIAGNRAHYGAGIFSCSGTTCPATQPGGLVTWMLTNNIITDNIASQRVGGIHAYSGSTFGDGGTISLSMRNDIVWGNTDPQVTVEVEPRRSGVTTVKASYSDIGLVDARGGGTYTPDHVINKDPLFVDSANHVFFLQEDSPCIDSGDPSSTYNDGKRPPAKGTERNDMGSFGGPTNVYYRNCIQKG